MNILYIAQYYPENLLPLFLEKTKVGLDFAANNLNRAIIKGFKDNGQYIDIINIPPLGSYPPYFKTPFIPGYKSDDCSVNSLSFLNISKVKHYSISRKIEREIARWCDNTSGKKVILFYNYIGLKCLPIFKAKYKDLRVGILVTDLPEFMAANNSFLTRLNTKISSISACNRESYFDQVDGYILLAPAMKERLLIESKPWIQIEGIYNPESDDVKVEKLKEKVILYTGNLGRRYGIPELLEAFHNIDKDNYRLCFCGSGDGLEDIKKYASIDNRIAYLGTFSRKEIIKLQKQATLLINPRHSADEYTIYSFPSKTMEYMASGTPTLMSKLKSIPQEYDQHLFYFTDESVKGFSDKIVEICEKSAVDLEDFGYSASQFIMKKKTPKPQVCKIINFLNNL